MFFAPRRSVPWSLLGGPVAPQAARSGRDLRDDTAPAGIASPSSPGIAPSNLEDSITSTSRELLGVLGSFWEFIGASELYLP